MLHFISFRLTLLAALVFCFQFAAERCTAQDSAVDLSSYQGYVESSPAGETRRLATGEFPALVVPDGAEPGEDPGEGEGFAGGFAGPIVTTVSSLLVVLAIFGGLVWVSRRYGSARTPAGALPEDVLRNLGSAAIDAKTRVTFLKVGQRILVIGQTQSGDPQTLSEITESDEVDRLTNRCLGRPEIVGRRGSYTVGIDASRREIGAG